ncbi:MAG: hypothetical protein DRJ42_22915 [Deltaproteobacteria bacterium]|nr:MAG: hypothetical protein DRJ42_22915 [Deltaproteobacteria bacterium]
MKVLHIALVIAAMAALLTSGCGDFATRGAVDEDSTDSSVIDGDGDVIDPGASDSAAPTADAGPPPPAEQGLLARDASEDRFSSASGMAECFTGECGASSCDSVRSCCVGAGTCCAPLAASVLPSLDSSSCGDGPAGDCFAGVTLFGSPTPSISGDGISPGGDGDGDSGFLTDATVDLTQHRVSVTAKFTSDSTCDAGCFETAGVGVTTQSAVTGELRTLASLQYAASRKRLMLMVRDVVVWFDDDPPLATDYVLDLQPTGEVSVRAGLGGSALFTAHYRPDREAHLAVFGHSLNPAGGDSPTTIQIMDVAVELCDVPTGWRDRQQVLVDGAPVFGRSASLATGANRALAYEQGGEIFFALGTDVPHEFTSIALPGTSVSPATVASLVSGTATVSDPELVRHGEGWRLFFTLRDDGIASIARQDFSLDFQTEELPEIAVGSRTETFDDMNDVTIGVSEPTVFEHDSGAWVLIVRAQTPAGTWLEIHRSEAMAADTFNLFDVPLLRSLTGRGDGVTEGFSRDEVAHPALSIHNGAWHLHFSARRGTRTSIGLLVSDDLLGWRSPTGGAVLDAGAANWEALGVSQADVTGAGDTLEMVYSGLDGVRSTLGWATRSGTDSGSF